MSTCCSVPQTPVAFQKHLHPTSLQPPYSPFLIRFILVFPAMWTLILVSHTPFCRDVPPHLAAVRRVNIPPLWLHLLQFLTCQCHPLVARVISHLEPHAPSPHFVLVVRIICSISPHISKPALTSLVSWHFSPFLINRDVCG